MKALIMLDEQGGKHLASSSYFFNYYYYNIKLPTLFCFVFHLISDFS